MIRPMMIFFALGLAAALQLARPAASIAVTVSYSFDGTLSDYFGPVPGIDPLVQSGGMLSYHNGGVAGPDDTEGLVSTAFGPGYNQSWSASIQATVPASYGPVADDPGEDYLGVGIAAFFFGGSGDSVLDGSLEVNEGGRVYWSGHQINDAFVGFEDETTTDTTGTLTLDFDAVTKILSLTGGGILIHSVDIDASGTDWAMTGSDQFTIAIFGTSENEAVSDSVPLELDDFFATTFALAVPEPSALTLAALGILSLSFIRRRKQY